MGHWSQFALRGVNPALGSIQQPFALNQSGIGIQHIEYQGSTRAGGEKETTQVYSIFVFLNDFFSCGRKFSVS